MLKDFSASTFCWPPAFAILSLATLFYSATCFAEDLRPADAEVVSKLKSIWSGQSAEISTAQITCRYLNRSASKKTSRQRTIEVLQALDLVGRPDDARVLSESLGLGIPANSACWGTIRLYYEPGGFRQTLTFDDKPFNELIHDQADDVVRADFANNQVQISPPGTSRRRELKLEQLRPTLKGMNLENAILVSRQNGNVVLDVGPQRIVADEASGFISQITVEAKGGKLVSISSFKDPREYAGDILFPTEIVFSRYLNDHLLALEILIVEQAQFNLPPPPDALALAVEKGAKVFDRRKGDVDFHQPTQSVPDIKKEIDRLRGLSNVSSPWSAVRQVVFSASLLLFMVFLVIAARRRIKARLAHS